MGWSVLLLICLAFGTVWAVQVGNDPKGGKLAHAVPLAMTN